MNYSVRVTPKFEKELKKLAKKYSSIKIEFPKFVLSLKENPTQGISLGNHCFKIRFSIASKGKGKSGGARIITYVKIQASTVYLLTIYDKSERESISNSDLSDLLVQIT